MSITANDDVNVNGSRIATFDGGDVTVLSKTGDVNAGSGGLGFVPISFPQLNPDGSVQVQNTSISGSGILRGHSGRIFRARGQYHGDRDEGQHQRQPRRRRTNRL